MEIHDLIGRDADTITWWQMVVRAVLIFAAGLVLVRVGGKRAFGRITTFDIVMSVILGSILSRALTANAQFFPTLAASAALVVLHALLAWVAARSAAFGHAIKGKETELVRDGRVLHDAMRRSHFTEHDLAEELRLNGVEDPGEVRRAYLERNGRVSVLKRQG